MEKEVRDNSVPESLTKPIENSLHEPALLEPTSKGCSSASLDTKNDASHVQVTSCGRVWEKCLSGAGTRWADVCSDDNEENETGNSLPEPWTEYCADCWEDTHPLQATSGCSEDGPQPALCSSQV